VGCGSEGLPEIAIHLPSARRVRWEPSAGPVAWGPGRVVDVLRGVFDLASGAWSPAAEPFRGVAWGPPGLWGAVWAVPVRDGVHVMDLGVNGHPVWASRPWGGMAPAVGAGRVVWAVDAGPLGIDLHVRAVRGGATAVIAGGPGDQRAPVSDGRRFAWVDAGRLVVWDTVGPPTPLPVLTGLSAPPAIDGDALCAEVRGPEGHGIDIWCADGQGPAGPGDQTHPSLGGGYLLWRESRGRVFARPVAAP